MPKAPISSVNPFKIPTQRSRSCKMDSSNVPSSDLEMFRRIVGNENGRRIFEVEELATYLSCRSIGGLVRRLRSVGIDCAVARREIATGELDRTILLGGEKTSSGEKVSGKLSTSKQPESSIELGVSWLTLLYRGREKPIRLSTIGKAC